MTGYGENNVVMPNTVDVLAINYRYLGLGINHLCEGETRSRSCVERMARKRWKVCIWNCGIISTLISRLCYAEANCGFIENIRRMRFVRIVLWDWKFVRMTKLDW
jgi:hypothetical protein